ncbi:uncharacterized protein BX664DRAFT_387253 [Halteromyces radiatus]|uniref:uncharacterized protein n=1 Tax=Halteromyces radiatus TaxID=101107 RepID=UPI00221F4864|nr:uncharacterized protein BX664DRAFT_387253 [Halteromyces radiatus]KAI8084526.1 hypothetical protein BX664DRAFT_387253 [Halteromyces radiatus]
MLDKVLLRLKEEVAMDGYQGTSINDMWSYVQRFLSEQINNNNNNNRDAKIEPVVDMNYKKYFWSQLRYVPELSFFEQHQLASIEQQMKNNNSDGNEDTVDLDYNLLNHLVELGYDQVDSKYGSQLRVVAEKKLQEAQLFVDVPFGQTWSTNLRKVLTTILQAREGGVTQAELTNIWNFDPRSTGHYVKSLEKKGAIFRAMVTVNATRTNICIHTRFNKGEPVLDCSNQYAPNNVNMKGEIFTMKVFRDRLTVLLSDAKDHTMFSTDILTALGFNLANRKVRKWFNRTIDSLTHQGVVRKLAAQKNNTGPRHRCIQLLDSKQGPLDTKNVDEDDDVDMTSDVAFDDLEPFVLKPITETAGGGKLLHGVSLDYQILQVIRNAGEQGITQKDIGIAVRCDNIRVAGRVMERLIEIKGDARFKYGIERVLEFEGRNRRYRYYSYANYLKVQGESNLEIPPFEPFSCHPSYLREVDYRAIQPDGKKGKLPKTSKATKASKATKTSKTTKTTKTYRIPMVHSEPLSPTNDNQSPSIEEETSSVVTDMQQESVEGTPSAVTDIQQEPVQATSSTTTDIQQEPIQGTSSTTTDIEQEAVRESNVRSRGKKRATSDSTSDQSTKKKQRPQRTTANKIVNYFKKIIHQADSDTSADSSESPSASSSPSSTYSASSPSSSTTSDVSTEHPSTQPSVEPIMPSAITSTSTSSSITPVVEKTPSEIASTDTEDRRMTDNNIKTKPVQINKYLQQRKEIIMALLEDKHIVERGIELRNLFMAKRKELYDEAPESSHQIDSKTLWRSVVALKEEGQVHTREGQILLLNGKKMTKHILIHKSLDPNGTEVNDYFDYMNERKVMKTHITKMETIEKASVDVEGLDDRLTRMQKLKEEALANNKMMEAKRIDMEIQQIKGNSIISGETWDPSLPKKVSNWLMVAMQFGYANSRMVRIKLFHQYLLGILLLDKEQGVDTTTRTISTNVIIHRMTLAFLCKVIGVFHPTDEFREYVQDEAHGNVTFIDLPNSVRSCILHEKNRFRYRVRGLLQFLVFLGVLEMVQKKNMTAEDIKEDEDKQTMNMERPLHLGVAYRLTDKTTVRNYRLPDRPIVQEHSLLTQADALMYWSDLQYVCTKLSLSDGESAVPILNDDSEIWIRSLYATKNWSINFVFSQDQRKVLNKNVDRQAQTTPLNSTAWCRSIATDLGVSIDAVRGYYRKVEDAMERSARRMRIKSKQQDIVIIGSPQRRRRQRRQEPPRPRQRQRRQIYDRGVVSDSNKVITLATTSPFKFNQHSMKQGRRLAMQQRREQQRLQQLSDDDQDEETKSSRLFLDDDTTIPLMTQEELSTTKLMIPRSKRKTWTTEEDDLLKLCYVISNHRREAGCRFSWKPIEAVLNIVPARCRRRITFLKETAKHAEDLQKIRVKWHRFYNQGVREGVITTWKKVADTDFGLVDYVTYYLEQSQLEDIQDTSSVVRWWLPTTAQMIENNFNVTTIAALNKQSISFMEDEYHTRNSAILMRQTLCTHAFTQRVHLAESYDNFATKDLTETDCDRRKIELLKQLFKMILMTPAELYDPYYAHTLVSSFPQSLLTCAITESRAEGVLVKAKGERITDRRIPKTLLGFSERFMRNMAVQTPENIWSQAREYERHLVESKTSNVDPVVLNSGMMACILDLVSTGNLSIKITNFDEFIEKHGAPNHASRGLKEKNTDYDMTLLFGGTRDDIQNVTLLEPEVKCLTDKELNSILGGLAVTQPGIYGLVQKIVRYLESRGNMGATLLEMKQNLLIEDDELFMAGVNLVTRQVQPPLATFVGYHTSRLILSTELDTWTVITRDIEDKTIEDVQQHMKRIHPPDDDDDDMVAIKAEPGQEMMVIQRKEVVKPFLWMDINGNKTVSIWKGCVDILVDTLMHRPGITFGHLCRVLVGILSPVEIKDLIQVLLSSGALRQLSITSSSSSCSLFSSSLDLRTATSNSIDPSLQTSYWLTPGYYNKIYP